MVATVRRVSQPFRRHHARRRLRQVRVRAAPADGGAERPVPVALLHGSHGPAKPGDPVSARGLSLSARAVPRLAPPHGHRALADRQPPVLLTALLERQVVFFGGKGGVGKTTCSAAFALAASRKGRRVLLVSTDPAHSTSDIFERHIGPSERQLFSNLSALEIDSEAEAARYIADVKVDIRRMFSPNVLKQANRQIDMAAASPGLLEVALLDRIIDLIVDRERDFDLIVFDTAPTGHTLQLLRMPDAMNAWIQALVKHRRAVVEIDRGSDQTPEAAAAADPVLGALERRRARIGRLRSTIMDRSMTSFVFVTIPERLAIEETARAAELLSDTGVDVGGLVVNRVLPDDLQGDFYHSRKAQEQTYLAEIDRRFKRLSRVRVRQLPRDVYGIAPLEQISAQLL
ncbi:MAG: AAA family ATPase [Luteitalea sp.]|nr:AAA family ATPase [Luteitalea sp.]